MAEAEIRGMQLSSEELKSSLMQKIETKNKSFVELQSDFNEMRMKNIQQNNKVMTPEKISVNFLFFNCIKEIAWITFRQYSHKEDSLVFYFRFKSVKILFKIWSIK